MTDILQTSKKWRFWTRRKWGERSYTTSETRWMHL